MDLLLQLADKWAQAADYYEMVAKTVKNQAVKTALSIAYVKTNRMEDAEKLCKLSRLQEETIFYPNFLPLFVMNILILFKNYFVKFCFV